jgi:hypothetical protein
MPGLGRVPHSRSDDRYGLRVLRALDPRRAAVVGLATLALSLGPLYSAELGGFFSPAEIAIEWLRHAAELAVVAFVLTVGYTLLDEGMPPRVPLRVAMLCLALLALCAGLVVLLHAFYAEGFEHLPPPRRLLADTLRYGLPGVFLILVAHAHRRALATENAARAAESTRAALAQDRNEQQLGLLQAQIEPHFLFNVLANVRRLYRVRPQSAPHAVASLMRYLQAALPQMRAREGTLGDELELARAYLDLCKVRMGDRLAFEIDASPALCVAAFPPMLVVTLVENAIKHGLEPVGGGRVMVRARREHRRLCIDVLDDGAGFGAAGTGGTGVGLANIRRQLAARYRGEARLTLAAGVPRGATASLAIPHAGP